MSIEQTIGREIFKNLETVIQDAVNRKDMTGVMIVIETTLEIVFKRGQEESAAMRAAGFPLRVAGVKKNTTELVTAGLVGDLEEGDGFHVKPGIPSVIHADSASGAGVGRLIQAERDRERHRIARDLKKSSSQPLRPAYKFYRYLNRDPRARREVSENFVLDIINSGIIPTIPGDITIAKVLLGDNFRTHEATYWAEKVRNG